MKRVFFILMMVMLIAFPVQAAEFSATVESENMRQKETEFLPEGVTNSKDTVESIERSSIIAAATAEIIDETGGDIGVIIETLCHVECNEIRNIAVLEKYVEDSDSWVEIARYDFIAKKEDFPNTSLTSLTNSFTIENQETGYYYRIRGIHSVTTTDGKGQVYSTRTSGLLITEYGR